MFLKISQYEKDGTKNIIVKNYTDQIISFDHIKNPYYNYIPDSLRIYYNDKNVIIKDNNSATNENKRTINIFFIGFTEYSDSTKQIVIYSSNGMDNRIITPEDSIFIHFDSEGT